MKFLKQVIYAKVIRIENNLVVGEQLKILRFFNIFVFGSFVSQCFNSKEMVYLDQDNLGIV